MTGASLVMIAAHNRRAQTARMRRYFVGTGAITHHIPQVGHQIVLGSGGKGCLKGFQVGMNIAEQQHSHKWSKITRGARLTNPTKAYRRLPR